jgi:hypothetical protein
MFSGNSTVAAARHRPLSRSDGPATPPSHGLCRALHSHPRSQAAFRPRLGARGQGRRLPADRAPRPCACSTAAAMPGPIGIPLSLRPPPSYGRVRSRWTARRSSPVPTVLPCSNALHRRHKATDAMLYAFDLLESQRRGSAAAAPRQAQGEAGEASGARTSWHRAQRAHRRKRRRGVPARMQDGPGGDRVETPGIALSIRPVPEWIKVNVRRESPPHARHRGATYETFGRPYRSPASLIMIRGVKCWPQ